MRQEADRCRAEADSAAILGTHEREVGNRCRDLLEQAEAKQIKSHRREREADDLQKLASGGERNIHRLCDQLLVNGRQRGDVQKEKEREERRVAALGETLWRYKREMGN